MKLLKKVNALCMPSYIYFMISVISLVIVLGQTLVNGNMQELCVGNYTCNVSNVVLVLVLHSLYVVFWTVVLDALCKYGLKNVSWLVLLLPFGLTIALLGLALVNYGSLLA